MMRQKKLFLAKNTLPLFDRLLDLLDTLPGELRNRSASPFFYAGLATRYEDERLTEDDRDKLPERINNLRSGRFATWLSEREWMPIMPPGALSDARLCNLRRRRRRLPDECFRSTPIIDRITPQPSRLGFASAVARGFSIRSGTVEMAIPKGPGRRRTL
jgi:hypothetical protein